MPETGKNWKSFTPGFFGWKIEEWKLPGGDVPEKPENRYWVIMTAPAES